MRHLLEWMASDLLIPIRDLLYLVRSSPYRYKVFEIEKRQAGKKRTIAQPALEVKHLQYWVMKNVLSAYPIHRSAMAYRKGKDIGDNAGWPCREALPAKNGFQRLFPFDPSVDFRRFLDMQKIKKFDAADIDHLCRILFWDRDRSRDLIMSIGAPTSPMLSNILMYEFDSRIKSLCSSKRIRYTRYADDLTFSTNVPNRLKAIGARRN